MSESGGETLVTCDYIAEPTEAASWFGNAQVAALTNTLTALTLAGVFVANTALDDVAQGLKKVVTVTPASLGVEVECTIRPRSCCPRIVDNG